MACAEATMLFRQTRRGLFRLVYDGLPLAAPNFKKVQSRLYRLVRWRTNDMWSAG